MKWDLRSLNEQLYLALFSDKDVLESVNVASVSDTKETRDGSVTS